MVHSLPLLKLKIGPFYLFFYFENLVLPAERRIFSKQIKIKNIKTEKKKKKHLVKLKIGPIMLCATYLDQILTLTWTNF